MLEPCTTETVLVTLVDVSLIMKDDVTGSRAMNSIFCQIVLNKAILDIMIIFNLNNKV